MSNFTTLAKDAAQDMRYFPVLISALILGLLLLFFKELTEPMRQYLIPSMAIYTLGSAFLAYAQSMFALRRKLKLEAEEKSKKYNGNHPVVFGIILCLQTGWFIWLVYYNFHRGVL